MLIHGHERSYDSEQQIGFDISFSGQVSFDLHYYVLKHFWGHQRSMKVSLRSVFLPLWTYFLCITAVLSFHFLCSKQTSKPLLLELFLSSRVQLRSLEVNSGSWEVIWTAKGLSHIMSFGGQIFLYTSCICSKTQSFKVIKDQWRSVIWPLTCLDIFSL